MYDMISTFASVSMTLLTPIKSIHAYPCIHGAHPGAHWRARQSTLSQHVLTLAQGLDGQPAPAQDTKLHLLPPKAAVANLKRFVRRHRKSEVSWGRTQQLSSCRTRFGSNLATICQRQLKDSQYAQGMHKTCLLLSPLGCLKCWGALTDHILL